MLFKRKKKEIFPTEAEIAAQIEAMPIEEVIAQVQRNYEALSPEQKALARYLVEKEKQNV